MRFATISLVLTCIALAPQSLCAPDGQQEPPVRNTPLPLKVVGTNVVNSEGKPVLLRGVNTASMEWSSDGEGHILETVEHAIKEWKVNHIRLPLAQDRWFGKAPEQKDDGAAYRALVRRVVDTCSSQGVYIILDLHWSDAGEWGKQIGQHNMPDQNSLEFWKSCAHEYKNHPAVLFDLYNEPHDVSWDIWRQGGRVEEKAFRRNPAKTYEAVGMQTLLDAIRATGAKNLLIAGGLDWSYDMSGFLEGKRLSDPGGNGVIYANHAYPIKGDAVEKWLAKMEEAAKVLPVIVSEFGAEETRTAGRTGLTGAQWVCQVLQALEDHHWAWTAWDLHPAAGPRLISDWQYTPTRAFGVPVKQALEGKPPSHQVEQPSATTEKPAAVPPQGSQAKIGLFDGRGDIGDVLNPGVVEFDSGKHTYTITGSGENIWFNKDAFYFVWKKTTGDVALSADISLLGKGINPHRKACLMVRQSLDPDSAYVDVALHGDGLTSLQFRDTKGGQTHEVQSAWSAPNRVAIVKRGKYALLYASPPGEDELKYSGAATRIAFEQPFYVGIGVCAHEKDGTETAVFSNVSVADPSKSALHSPGRLDGLVADDLRMSTLVSTLETMTMASTDRRVVHVAPARIEAPNWLGDGKSLIFNSDGRIFRIATSGGRPAMIDTGFATRCNNDHGVSPDGKLLAISDQSQGDHQSRIYTLPVSGGSPTLVTESAPSYWHGWSPDGRILAYCAERNGDFDIYTIGVEGGRERRLTTAAGLDDGPEFSPDGKYVYFNSNRAGTMQIWRMKPDGGDQLQITKDEHNNWFPHPSPDGKQLVFLSYEKDVVGHPPDKDVMLRRLDLATNRIEVLARFLGGQGTINVPCWSPDGRQIAFVTYQYIP